MRSAPLLTVTPVGIVALALALLMVSAIAAATQPGDYRIEITATSDGKKLGTARGEFMVFDQDAELANAAADHDQLARLANLTKEFGGKPVAPEQLAALLEELTSRPGQFQIEVQTRWQLADTSLDAWLFHTQIADLVSANLAGRLPPWYLQRVNAPSFLLLPLVMKNATFALIYADHAQARAIHLGEQELSLLRTLRSQAVMAFKQVGGA